MKTDLIYIRIKTGKIYKTHAVNGVIYDFDENNKLLGIELINGIETIEVNGKEIFKNFQNSP